MGAKHSRQSEWDAVLKFVAGVSSLVEMNTGETYVELSLKEAEALAPKLNEKVKGMSPRSNRGAKKGGKQMVSRARYCRSESPRVVDLKVYGDDVTLKFYGDDVTSWTDEDTGETYVEMSLKEAEKLAYELENVVYPPDDDEEEESTTPTAKEDEENKEVARMMKNDIHEELQQLVVDLKDEVDRVYDLVLELQEL